MDGSPSHPRSRRKLLARLQRPIRSVPRCGFAPSFGYPSFLSSHDEARCYALRYHPARRHPGRGNQLLACSTSCASPKSSTASAHALHRGRLARVPIRKMPRSLKQREAHAVSVTRSLPRSAVRAGRISPWRDDPQVAAVARFGARRSSRSSEKAGGCT